MDGDNSIEFMPEDLFDAEKTEITFEEGSPSWMQDDRPEPTERGVFPGIPRVKSGQNWEFREEEITFDTMYVGYYQIDSEGHAKPAETVCKPAIYVSAKDAHIVENHEVLKHIYENYGNTIGIITTESLNPKLKNVMTRKIVLGTLE